MWDREYCLSMIASIEARIAAADTDDTERVTALWKAHDVWCEMYAGCKR